MAEGKCLNCGKIVKVDDKFVGKRIKCPSCGTAVLVGGLGDVRLDKTALRQELSRLSGMAGKKEGREAPEPVPPGKAAGPLPPMAASGKPGPDSAVRATRLKPKKPDGAEHLGGVPSNNIQIEQAQKSYRGIIIALVIIVALAAAGGAGAILFNRSRKNKKDVQENARTDVIALIESANRVNKPCKETEALKMYEQALEQARAFQRLYRDGSFQKKIPEIQQRIITLKKFIDSRGLVLNKLGRRLAAAKSLIAEKKYAEAAKELELAAQSAKDYPTDCKTDPVLNVKKELLALQQSDDIRFRSKGLVQFEEKWVTPREQKDLLAKKKEQEYKKKGLVKFLGKWVTPEEKKAIIEKEKAIAEARKKEWEKRKKARDEREKRIAAARDARAKLKDLVVSNDAKIYLDDLSAGVLWRNEGWANKIKYEIVTSEKHGKKGQKFLQCTLEPGEKEKWVMSLPAVADFSKRDYVVGDLIVLKGKMKIALGVWTQPQWLLYESPVQRFKKGNIYRSFSFPLKAKNFKSKSAKWTYTSAVENPDKVVKLSLFIYGGGNARILLSNIQAIKGNPPKLEIIPTGK